MQWSSSNRLSFPWHTRGSLLPDLTSSALLADVHVSHLSKKFLFRQYKQPYIVNNNNDFFFSHFARGSLKCHIEADEVTSERRERKVRDEWDRHVTF